MERFAGWLEERRGDPGWTLRQLAGRIGVAPTSVVPSLAARSLPGPDVQERPAAALGVPVDRGRTLVREAEKARRAQREARARRHLARWADRAARTAAGRRRWGRSRPCAA